MTSRSYKKELYKIKFIAKMEEHHGASSGTPMTPRNRLLNCPQYIMTSSPDKKNPQFILRIVGYKPGNNLLSHDNEVALSSAVESLTAVFGMGTGVSSHLWSPECYSYACF